MILCFTSLILIDKDKPRKRSRTERNRGSARGSGCIRRTAVSQMPRQAANELMQLKLGEDSFKATQNVTANKPSIFPAESQPCG